VLETHLRRLCEELELDPIAKEGEEFPIPINSSTLIIARERDPGLSFFAKIGACPLMKREDFFIYLMKANYLGQGTGGSVIALDENENFLTLSLVLPYDMNYKIFKDALEDFTNYLDYWKEELIRHNKAAEESIL
jgi:hypothetical protein